MRRLFSPILLLNIGNPQQSDERKSFEGQLRLNNVPEEHIQELLKLPAK